MITTQHQTVLGEYLMERIGIPYSTDLICMGHVKGLRLIGVVGFNQFTGSACHMHMAGEPGWMTRKLVYEAFRYPFQTLDLAMVFGTVPSGNIRALDIDRRLGFTELLFIPGAHPDGGIHLLQMLRENCRWLRKDDGKEIHAKAA